MMLCYLENMNHYERIHVLKKMEYNLKNYDKKETKKEIFKILNKCRCCSDHQVNKPSIEDFNNFYGKYHHISENKIKFCKCPCRHICRMICNEVYSNK